MKKFFKNLKVLNAQTISSPNCGLRPLAFLTQKIVNGVKAIPGDWAWSVSLSQNGRHFCGGVLISNEWVLSGMIFKIRK